MNLKFNMISTSDLPPFYALNNSTLWTTSCLAISLHEVINAQIACAIYELLPYDTIFADTEKTAAEESRGRVVTYCMYRTGTSIRNTYGIVVSTSCIFT